MSKILKVPYLSQRDNQYNPSGSCNVTCFAMALKYYGIVGDNSEEQLEDQLYRKATELGLSRHDPNDLKKLVETLYPGNPLLPAKLPAKFGPKIKDDLTFNGTLDDIRNAIDAGLPCIVHGYFTKSGHIVLICGYDDNGFFVNDPWGEYWPNGYNTSTSGEGLHYSNKLISIVCSPESSSNPKDIWLHRIRRVN